jgi:hypothetical protein
MSQTTSPIPVDPNQKFDVRVVEHQVRKNQLDRAAYDAWIAALPDEAEHAVESSVRFSTPYADKVRRARR